MSLSKNPSAQLFRDLIQSVDHDGHADTKSEDNISDLASELGCDQDALGFMTNSDADHDDITVPCFRERLDQVG